MKEKKICAAFFSALVLVFLCQPGWVPAQQDSTASQTPAELSVRPENQRLAIRGIEREARGLVDPAHLLLGSLFFIPRYGLDGLFYATRRGAGTFADPEFIDRSRG